MKNNKKNLNVNSKIKKKGKIRENIEIILSAIGIALLIRIFILEAYMIPTGSMIPNLLKQDRLIVNKFTYGVRLPVVGWKLPAFTKPENGDIIVFQSPNYRKVSPFLQMANLITFGVFGLDNKPTNPKILVKRTLGTPGDIIEIRMEDRTERDTDGNDIIFKYQKLIVNGKELKRKRVSIDEIKLVYIEDNGKRKYKIQYMKNRTGFYSIRGKFYVPSEGDNITLKIKGMFESNQEVDLYSSTIVMTINNSTKLNIDGNVFISLYNNDRNKIFPKKILKELLTKGITKYRVQSNYYFMMGDNRDNSADSRRWGMLNEDLIMGSPMIIYFPFKRIGTIR